MPPNSKETVENETKRKSPRIEILMERNAKQSAQLNSSTKHREKSCKCHFHYPNKTRTEDRNCMSKKQYIKVLSTPRTYPKEEEVVEKKKKKYYGPCPPRIEELARPYPTRVLNTWQSYYDVLPPERMEKLQSLLYNVSYMEPKKAIHHFKKRLNKQRKQTKTKKKTQQQQEQQKQLTMMQNEEMQTAKAIMNYLKNKPLVSVKYRHMCISDKLLGIMCEKNLLRKPRRKTKSSYEKSIIEIADQVAVWFDKLVEDLERAEEEDEESDEEVASDVEVMSGVVGRDDDREKEGGESEEEDETEEEEEWSMESAGVQVSLFEELLEAETVCMILI